MNEFEAEVIQDKITVLPTFEQNDTVEVRINNKSDTSIQGRLQIMFPKDIEWKIGEKETKQGEYKAKFTIPPDTQRELGINLQAIGQEARKSSIMVNLETQNEKIINEKIIKLDLRPND